MFQQGYSEALMHLGFEKNAAGWWAAKAVPKLKEIGQSALTNFIGQPKQFGRELRSGTAFGSGGLIREGFKAPGIIQKGLMYGFPAVSAIQTIRSNDPDKGGALGGLIGGTLASSAAFGPLGMLGAMPAGYLGEVAGKRLVHGAKNILGIGNQTAPRYTSLQQ
jgi:hypothetical protein